MGLLPQDQRGQILLMLTVAAAVGAWVFWQGQPVGPDTMKVKGWAEMRDSIREYDSIATDLEGKVATVKRAISIGAMGEIDAKLERYRASLAQIRQLVPTTTQVANLIDGISTQVRVRRATLAEFNPMPPETGFRFDRWRYRIRLAGTFDQIGETLADIASLDQVVAPYDLELGPVNAAGADTTARMRGLLDARFVIMTYVRTAPNAVPGSAAPPLTPMPAPAVRAPVTPPGGGAHE